MIFALRRLFFTFLFVCDVKLLNLIFIFYFIMLLGMRFDDIFLRFFINLCIVIYINLLWSFSLILIFRNSLSIFNNHCFLLLLLNFAFLFLISDLIIFLCDIYSLRDFLCSLFFFFSLQFVLFELVIDVILRGLTHDVIVFRLENWQNLFLLLLHNCRFDIFKIRTTKR